MSAIRAKCEGTLAERATSLVPVLSRIGGQLDVAISKPELDRFLTSETKQVIVAISDARWRNAVLLAAYGEAEIRSITMAAKSALNATVAGCAVAGASVRPADCVIFVWEEWLARKAVRAGTAILENPPDLPVGSFLLCCPDDVRGQIDEIARSDATPVLAIAANSIGTKRGRPKCRLLSLVFALPGWARSGAIGVAGNA